MEQSETKSNRWRTSYVLALLAFSYVPCGAIGQTKFTIEDVLRSWEHRQRQVETIRFEWTEEVARTRGSVSRDLDQRTSTSAAIPPQDYTFAQPSFLALDRKSVTYRYRTRMWRPGENEFQEMQYKVGFDGQFQKSHFESGRPMGNVRSQRSFGDQTVMHIRPILMAFRATDEKIGPYRGFPFKLTGNEAVIGKSSCHEIRNMMGTKTKELLWVDPLRRFVAVRFEIRNGNSVLWRVNVDEYEIRDGGIQVPKAWSIFEYHADGSTQLSSRARVTTADINATLSEVDLAIDFPPGTAVMDDIRNITYVQKEGGRTRELSPEEMKLSYDEQVALPVSSRWHRLGTWPVILAFLALILAGLILVIRLRARRAENVQMT